MAQRFAILDWGSLLWDDSHPKFNAQIHAWQYDGPVLPVEFSRISASRDGALTLVIDTEHGSPVTSAWCLSRRTDFESVIEDFRVREGTSRRKIGYVRGNDRHGRDPEVLEVVQAWADARKLDGVVWIDLESNFHASLCPPRAGLGEDAPARCARRIHRLTARSISASSKRPSSATHLARSLCYISPMKNEQLAGS
jgi:hypothetical protein